jgi:RNA polymerase sigma-70 factor (ECF subfamily)
MGLDRETATPDSQRAVAIRDQLDRGFRRLLPEERAIIVLRHYLGLSTHECAEILQIPPGTVQSRLHYAMDAMRTALAADERGQSLAVEAVR